VMFTVRHELERRRTENAAQDEAAE
jgi:hypothetical protein